jgi:foldase protein PrsA
VVATVNGRPIERQRLVELLYRSHGAGLLDQLVGLELAEQAAAKAGVTVGPADINRELDGALRRLSDPLATVTSASFDRTASAQLLEAVLRDRNMSREEFDLLIRRNALLRKSVAARETFTEDDLRREYDRIFGRRVRVRHIQLSSLAEVERVRERLAAGETFASIASNFSANTASARTGGLLEPFSALDEDLPAAFRQTALALNPGDVSEAVRVGQWYHLIQCDAVLPPENPDFGSVRERLQRSLHERVTDPQMFALFERLFKEAAIQVHDSELREGFEQRHPEPGGAGGRGGG